MMADIDAGCPWDWIIVGVNEMVDNELKLGLMEKIAKRMESDMEMIYVMRETLPFIKGDENKCKYLEQIISARKKTLVADNTVSWFESTCGNKGYTREEIIGLDIDRIICNTVASLDSVDEIMKYYNNMINPYAKRYILDQIAERFPEYTQELTKEELEEVFARMTARVKNTEQAVGTKTAKNEDIGER